jgi:4-azaleucine resistance transporter AzlC
MNATLTITPRAAFVQGLRDTVPLVVGAIPFGVIFGALGVTSGLSPMAVLAMSLFVFAGSSQFIATQLFSGGAPLPLIVFTTFVVNLRHALYSVTLSPTLRGHSQAWLAALSFWLTDETFAVTSGRMDSVYAPQLRWYQLASSLFMYTNWFACTLVGVIGGNLLPDAANWGLDFAMVVTFIGIVVPALRTRPLLLAAIVGGGVALLTAGLPNKLGILVGAFSGVAVAMWAEGSMNDVAN